MPIQNTIISPCGACTRVLFFSIMNRIWMNLKVIRNILFSFDMNIQTAIEFDIIRKI